MTNDNDHPQLTETLLETGLFDALVIAIDTDQLYAFGYYSVALLGILEGLVDDLDQLDITIFDRRFKTLLERGAIRQQTYNFIKEQTTVFILE